MSKIEVLPFEIANLIAAGEVVERPSSVLKELIENAIDAGAKHIVAEIKHGGTSLIRVTDDGCGMEREDLPIALKRHATSKIRSKDDLSAIMTLGFRGEALAAIASVCSLTIITKTAAAKAASMLTSEAGQILDVTEVLASDGTTVVVENLFGNVPARRKFLKKDATETMNVAALVEKVALSRPDISIQLLCDGEERFKTPGNGKLQDTVYAVLGKEIAFKLLSVEGTVGGITVEGFVGRSDNTRKNRNMENFFINGRYIRSLTAQAALEKAFTSYIAPEAFPICVLMLKMPPSVVDVNVHPAKLECKFSDERIVFEAVYYAVRSALEEAEYRPELPLAAKKSDRNALGAFVPIGADTKGKQISFRESGMLQESASPRSANQPAYLHQPPAEKAPARPAAPAFSSGVAPSAKPALCPQGNELTPKQSVHLLEQYEKAQPRPSGDLPPYLQPSPKSEPSCESAPNVDYKFVGEAYDTYLIVEYEGDLLILDKHAAHERVIFEELKKQEFAAGNVASQALLLPIRVPLSPENIAALREYTDDVTAVGFSFTVKDGFAELSAIPNRVGPSDAEALFISVTDELTEGRGIPQNTADIRREKALYQIACKAAIKGGRLYEKSVLDWLIRSVLSMPNITVCPHGRPIAYRLTKKEIDRLFDRIK